MQQRAQHLTLNIRCYSNSCIWSLKYMQLHILVAAFLFVCLFCLQESLELDKQNMILIARNDLQALKQELEKILASTWYNSFYVAIVLIDAVCIALQTSENIPDVSDWYLEGLQQLFVVYYQVEVILKYFVLGKRSLKNWWDNFGLLLVILDLVGLLLPLIVHRIGLYNVGSIHAIRLIALFKSVRVVRVLRAIRFLRSLQVIVVTLLAALPTIGAILVIMTVVLYVFAIIGRDLYGSKDPSRYGNIFVAGASLFQLLTLDDWFEMYTDVAKKYNGFQHILLFLIIFIVIEALIFVSLFVAVIVDNLARAQNTLSSLKKDGEEDMVGCKKNQELFAEKKDSVGPSTKYASGELEGKYLAIIHSLKIQLEKENCHGKTLERLVDMVDLSKLDQSV